MKKGNLNNYDVDEFPIFKFGQNVSKKEKKYLSITEGKKLNFEHDYLRMRIKYKHI